LNDTGESADALWKKVKDGIIDCDIPDARKEKIQEKSKHIDENAIATLLQSKAIDIITMHDERYPKKLKNIGHAPYFIFVRGTLRSDIPMIGIV
jgi:predicted Rossmann fold nucleotide-binding protein DprA/Smf involved in DNA uptake